MHATQCKSNPLHITLFGIKCITLQKLKKIYTTKYNSSIFETFVSQNFQVCCLVSLTGKDLPQLTSLIWNPIKSTRFVHMILLQYS